MIPYTESRGDAAVHFMAVPSLDPADQRTIAAYMLGTYDGPTIRSQDRSMHLPSVGGGRDFDGLKIKGAGFRGGRVDFSRRHPIAYPLPRYDHDGNCTLDVAKDFDRAWSGGMSRQQAENEFRIARHLTEREFDTFAPLAWGMLEQGGSESWFCVLSAPFAAPRGPREVLRTDTEIRAMAAWFGRSFDELEQLGVQLTLNGMVHYHGRWLRKDFHPARLVAADDGFVARLAYLLFDVNISMYDWLQYDAKTPGARVFEVAAPAFLEALFGGTVSHAEAQAFKLLCQKLKYPVGMPVELRVAMLAQDAVGARALARALRGESELVRRAVERWSRTPITYHNQPTSLAKRARGRASKWLARAAKELA